MRRCREVAPDGTVTNGPEYTPVEQPVKKKIFYGILRVVTIPVRQLL